MPLSQVIRELQLILDKHGELACVIMDTHCIETNNDRSTWYPAVTTDSLVPDNGKLTLIPMC